MAARNRSRKGKRSRKSRRGRRMRISAPGTNLTYSKGPLSTKLKATVRYVDYFTLNPGVAGALSNYVFSANGVYDPNITGVGHQPMGWDQLMTLYSNALVIGCKAKLTYANTDSTNAQHIVVILKDNSTPMTTINDALEYRTHCDKILSARDGPTSVGVLYFKCNPNRFLGKPNPLGDAELKCSSTANPTTQAYWHIYAQPQDVATDTSQIYCMLEVTYQVIFTEPKAFASS